MVSSLLQMYFTVPYLPLAHSRTVTDRVLSQLCYVWRWVEGVGGSGTCSGPWSSLADPIPLLLLLLFHTDAAALHCTNWWKSDPRLLASNFPPTSRGPYQWRANTAKKQAYLERRWVQGMEDFVCLCQAARKLATLDGSSAGPGFIDWPLPLLTSGYSTWVVLVLPCVMCLALTGCWRSPLSLTSLYDVMSEQPAFDGVIYITAALSLFQHRDTLIRTYEQKW